MKTSEERFWERVSRDAGGGCWLWTGRLSRAGYGVFWHDGKDRRAHRFAYEFLVGPIPDGLTLDHLCRTRSCVNPAHLEPVTQIVNVRRGNAPNVVARREGRCRRGHEFAIHGRVDGDGAMRCQTCHQAAKRKRRAQAGTEGPATLKEAREVSDAR